MNNEPPVEEALRHMAVGGCVIGTIIGFIIGTIFVATLLGLVAIVGALL